MKKPAFIVFCGGEGSGKSTVAEMVKRKYIPNIIGTREPGGSPLAEEVRKIMFGPLGKGATVETMFGLAWAQRSDHMKYTVSVALENGTPVLSDRGDCCTYAYQVHAQNGSHLKNVFWEMREIYLGKNKPDLYVYFDVDPAEGLRRVAGRPGKKNHFDGRDLAFHQKVRDGYMAFFEELKVRGGNSVIVNANQSLEKVQADVLSLITMLM